MHRLIYPMIAVWVLVASSACTTTSPPSQESIDIQYLRISNTGDEDIQDLVVGFPGNTSTTGTRVDFGNVGSGDTTGYQPIASGVYHYAAYEYLLGDETVFQAVEDWIGERPLAGTHFTYEIVLDPSRAQGDQIQLTRVRTDRR